MSLFFLLSLGRVTPKISRGSEPRRNPELQFDSPLGDSSPRAAAQHTTGDLFFKHRVYKAPGSILMLHQHLQGQITVFLPFPLKRFGKLHDLLKSKQQAATLF